MQFLADMRGGIFEPQTDVNSRDNSVVPLHLAHLGLPGALRSALRWGDYNATSCQRRRTLTHIQNATTGMCKRFPARLRRTLEYDEPNPGTFGIGALRRPGLA